MLLGIKIDTEREIGFMKRVLVVEDEASIREMVALNLKMAGWEVVEGPQCRARAGTDAQRGTLRCGTFGYYAAGHGRLEPLRDDPPR